MSEELDAIRASNLEKVCSLGVGENMIDPTAVMALRLDLLLAVALGEEGTENRDAYEVMYEASCEEILDAALSEQQGHLSVVPEAEDDE
jgi:hypothetical protein